MPREGEFHNPNWLSLDDLLELFPNYKTKGALYQSISRGYFPIPTFRFGGRRFADIEVVKAYFRKLRAEGLAELESAK